MAENKEWIKCTTSADYFIETYGCIYNATLRSWIKFELWPAQIATISAIQKSKQLIILKARQLGLTWLILGYALWLMVFRPAATVLLFSLRDDEAMELLRRLRGMYARLPSWAQARSVARSNDHTWILSNGSMAMAFPTTGGRSYTATLVIVDEADYIPNLSEFLDAVKPTVDAGGQLALISTVDKSIPLSTFKRIIRSAQKGNNEYVTIFLAWQSRPDRSDEWYRRVAADMYSQTGTNDGLHQEYPATIEEALAPRELDKRIPWPWIKACVAECDPVSSPLSISGLAIYRVVEADQTYVIGVDPAEGNPNSDESAAVVLDAESWAVVAVYGARVEPGTFACSIDTIGEYYNNADVMCERNNHGHTTIRALQESGKLRVLAGYDKRPGWLSSVRGKPLLYDAVAAAIKDQATTLRDSELIQQLASVEAGTLRAPVGLHDDRADAYALAIAALAYGAAGAGSSTVAPAMDPLLEYDRGRF